MRLTPGSSTNSTSNRAKSTWACTPGGQGGIGRQAIAQIGFEAIDDTRRRRALLVGRRLQPFGDVGPDGLSVDAGLPGDGADRQALAMQIQDHDELPKFDHRVLPPA